MRLFVSFFILAFLISSCVPREQVVLRKINDIIIETRPDGGPILKGQAVFFNPNNVRMKLKEINVQVFVDGKKSAHTDQKYNSVIPANAEFSVPLEIGLSLEKRGLLNTVLDLLGGKKYEIHYLGYIRIRIHGINVKVPVDYKDEIRLKI